MGGKRGRADNEEGCRVSERRCDIQPGRGHDRCEASPRNPTPRALHVRPDNRSGLISARCLLAPRARASTIFASPPHVTAASQGSLTHRGRGRFLLGVPGPGSLSSLPRRVRPWGTRCRWSRWLPRTGPRGRVDTPRARSSGTGRSGEASGASDDVRAMVRSVCVLGIAGRPVGRRMSGGSVVWTF